MGVFSKNHNPETTIKRNVVDMSNINHLTFNMGQIVPVFCKPVLNGDTVDIDLRHGLSFPPTYFPNQNKIRLDFHAFYCRDRNSYNEYKNFQSNNLPKDAKGMPYQDFSVITDELRNMYKDGGLADYMNVPTHFYGKKGTRLGFPPSGKSPRFFYHTVAAGSDEGINIYKHITSSRRPGRFTDLYPEDSVAYAPTHPGDRYFVHPRLSDGTEFHVSFTPSMISNGTAVSAKDITFIVLDGPRFTMPDLVGFPMSVRLGDFFSDGFFNAREQYSPLTIIPCVFGVDFPRNKQHLLCLGQSVVMDESDLSPYSVSELVFDDWSVFKEEDLMSFSYFVLGFMVIAPVITHTDNTGGHPTVVVDKQFSFDSTDFKESFPTSFEAAHDYDFQFADTNFVVNPFAPQKFGAPGDDPSQKPWQPLNTLCFRAYEQVYNAFFRDDRNNPMMLNGQPVYDVYCRSTDGGADKNAYPIYYRNWEQDAFTTALPSPQQGKAPLVGIVDSSTAIVSDPDTGKVYTAHMSQSEDGEMLDVKFTETNQDNTPIPTAQARSLVSLATSGISINDFRNVNALQRFLELNMMRGRKYKDVIEARWGVNISYAELDMPEFIGGSSSIIESYQVNQTTDVSDRSPLGAFAGQMASRGGSRHRIHHYCDETGFILIVASVVPVPVYTQSLPPHFTRFDILDFYQPEFGHIGLQPVKNSVVAPLQFCMQSQSGDLNGTFGYQRAWYDYLSSMDEAHGMMRNNMRDYLMYRKFSGQPKLSEDFLLVKPEDCDNIFSVQTDAYGNSLDKIFGIVVINAKFRRPIPLYGVPRLE